MRKFISLFLSFVLALGFFPATASAAEISETQNIITFEDGSYVEIHIDESSARASYSKSGAKTYTFYNSQNTVEWEAKLNASFTYNGTTSTCTSASCTVTIYDRKWYEVSNTTTRSGNTATTKLTLGQKFLGVTISKPQYTITLTCDKDGKLS